MATQNTTLSAAGKVTAAMNSDPNYRDNVATVEVSGTFTGVTAAFEGTADGTNWVSLAAIRKDTLAVETSPTVTDATARIWNVDVTGMQQFRVNVSVLGANSITVFISTQFLPSPPGNLNLQAALSGNQAITGTFAVTSASATALAVGANGATNPALVVDASTASSATGIKIKSAANSGAVAISVVSGAAAENLTVDAKGTGTLTLNGTATGNTVFGSNVSITDAKNISLAAGTGTKLGTATTQKLGFFNATPVVQPAASTDTTTNAAGSTTTVFLNTTFNGTGGTAAYTVGGIVTSLKALGLLAV